MELWAKNGLGIRFVVDWRKWDSGAVECQIEVLYDILALGVLEKMKIHPLIAMPAKVQKAGLYILLHSVKCRPALAVHVARPRSFIHTVPLYTLVLYTALQYVLLYFYFRVLHIIQHSILYGVQCCSDSCTYNCYTYNYQYILYYICTRARVRVSLCACTVDPRRVLVHIYTHYHITVQNKYLFIAKISTIQHIYSIFQYLRLACIVFFC